MSSFYADTGSSFSPTNFRNSFHNGIGRPSLFVFRIKRYPRIYNSPDLSVQNVLNNVLGSNSDALGLGISTSQLLNAGQTLYDSVRSTGLSELQFRVDKFGLPDKNIGTYTTKIYGPSSDFPREIENGSMSISILCGGDYYEHDFFTTWVDSILTYTGTKPNHTTIPQQLMTNVLDALGTKSNTAKGSTPYDIAYYDDIVTDAELVVYNEDGDASYVITFEDVYPKAVGGIGFDWNAKNEISTFIVTLHYRIMTSSKVNASLKTGSVLGGALNIATQLNPNFRL